MTLFNELGLPKGLVDAVARLGFEQPTPVQEKVIPHLLQIPGDIVALAQTGTGKTAAFGLPLLSLIDPSFKKVQALILCPTRELCLQIRKDLENFASGATRAKITAVYGGANIMHQIMDLKDGAQIIVATPGRMLDIMERKKADLSNVKYVVLDEADEMLNMGFKEDLDAILSHAPAERNTWLFSATMPPEVAAISRNYMSNPVEISSGKRNEGNENIEHGFYLVQARDKFPALKRIIDYSPGLYGIVFCRTKMETQQVAEGLMKEGYNADALHGDLSQAQRDQVMKRFRTRNLSVLVATDVAARGIDVADVTHVIHYNLPDESETYTHRSGRTARAGKKGWSLVLINLREKGKIRQLEKMTRRKFEQFQLPSGQEVCEKQLMHLVREVHDVEVNPTIHKFLPSAYEELKDLDREEIINRFLSIEFNRFLEYYKTAPDLNVDESRSFDSSRGGRENNTRLFLSLGELDGFDNSSLKKFIAQASGAGINNVVWTDMKNSYSFVEVREEVANQVITALQGEVYNDRQIKVERAGGSSPRGGGGGGGSRSGFKKKFGSAPRSSSGSRYAGNKSGGSGNSGGRFGGKKKRY